MRNQRGRVYDRDYRSYGLAKTPLCRYIGMVVCGWRQATSEMRLPGPDHLITMAPNPNRVRVTFTGRLPADTTRALTLKEASLPAVQYIPREDVDGGASPHRAHHALPVQG
jgi:Domain of unknown function (DUF427)